MPTKRTRKPRFGSDFMTETHFAWLRGEELDPDRHEWLVWSHLDRDDGHVIEPDPPRRTPFLESGISGRRLWSLYEADMLAEHIAESPGTRPYRWWQFSAPEPRRRLDGTPANPPMFESEAAYLERLGLLLPGERKRVHKKDFAPESVGDILGELEDGDEDTVTNGGSHDDD